MTTTSLRNRRHPMINDTFMVSPDRGCAPGKADPDFFFAQSNASATAAAKRATRAKRDWARRQCRERCPFTRQCFAWAEQSGQRHGFWGGVDMAQTLDRAKHRELWDVPDGSARDAELPLIDRVLAGVGDFQTLSAEDQVEAVNTGLERDETYDSLAKRFGSTAEALMLLVGERAETFDEQVKRLYAKGKSDRDIGLSLGVHAKTVSTSRGRQGLPTLYGPGGRHLTEAGREQRKQRFKQQDLIIRDLHGEGLNDPQIAERSGLTVDQVRWIRGTRLGLPQNAVTSERQQAIREREDTVRELYEQDLSDGAIAERTGLTTSYVRYIRGNRLKLPAKFGSRGRRIDAVAVPA
ncbi:WhiB family transcriptional regulator [Actinoplanes regularis]|uniref:WhiB family transcriptional regulator n=1 Tax=Actinoplanes regularis TaxID=52697 RepID=UPI00249FB9F7|nr:WhiB family transcriptional regulator [Actinoplanes regularis]GLW32251.1 hypothetical protein Areg01_51900 [Actinoplanes regularis]